MTGSLFARHYFRNCLIDILKAVSLFRISDGFPDSHLRGIMMLTTFFLNHTGCDQSLMGFLVATSPPEGSGKPACFSPYIPT